MNRLLCVVVVVFLLPACSDTSETDASPGAETGFPTAEVTPASGLADATSSPGPDVIPSEDISPGPPSESDTATSPETLDPPPCEGSCVGKDCGSDGCGGTCGSCSGGDICSEAGTCDPDPQAGCGGLELAENWEGTFDGTYDVAVDAGVGIPIPANSGDTSGTLSFSLTCLNSKFIISGEMTGTASDNQPFEATLAGTYNPSTKAMEGTIPEGSLYFPDLLDLMVGFEGEMAGFLQPGGDFAGSYDIEATSATSSLITLGEDDYDASSSGTWVASPAP